MLAQPRDYCSDFVACTATQKTRQTKPKKQQQQQQQHARLIGIGNYNTVIQSLCLATRNITFCRCLPPSRMPHHL